MVLNSRACVFAPREAQTKQEDWMASLSGKKVMVLGGSRGLGRVIVGAVHAEGGDVLAVARNAGPLAQLSSNGLA
jgi:hypothetical protein